MAGLYVAHWRFDGNLPAAHRWPDAGGLQVETCLRRVWVGATAPPRAPARGAEVYAAAAAYRFLLEFVTGLHSAIPGESNVLGQFRHTWFRWQAAAPAAAQPLTGTVAALLRDARQIRARHLQGVGGDSYGSLVRRLVAPAREDRVLLVGAGELARSIWPFFSQYATGFWNRRSEVARHPDWLRQFRPADGARAARWAQHVVLTTPPDPRNDSRWARWLDAAAPATVTHLGHRQPGAFAVANAGRNFFLEHLFELRQTRANVRSLQVEHARAACSRRAALNFLQQAAPPHRARA